MKEQIIQIIDDKQYKLDKLIISEMHGTEINELDKITLEIEIKTLTSILKLCSIPAVAKQFCCECDAPLIRTNGTGGEYCANCNLDLEQ